MLLKHSSDALNKGISSFVFLIAIVFRTQAEALEEAEKNPDEDKIEPWMPAPKPGGGAGK